MVTRTARLLNVVANIVSQAGADVATGPLSEEIHGKIQNWNFGGIEHVINDGFGPVGIDAYWNGTTNLPECSFEIVDWTQALETIGPVDVFMEFEYPVRSAAGTLVTAMVRLGFTFSLVGAFTWDRSTDTPRGMTLRPFELIIGGDANRQNLSADNAGCHINTRRGIYTTRLNGTGSQVDHYAGFFEPVAADA